MGEGQFCTSAHSDIVQNRGSDSLDVKSQGGIERREAPREKEGYERVDSEPMIYREVLQGSSNTK